MSVIEEDLLAPRITKRRVIEVLVVASLLISLFAFSTYIYALILGSQRRDPNERLQDADQEYPIKVFIEPPWDLDDIKDLLEDFDINITELAQETGLTEQDIEEYLEQVIPEMLDGSIDDLDLTSYGVAIAALLFSDAEVFRVYDYDEINQVNLREDILWKYECFDEFSGAGWHNTMSPEINNDYFTYDDYVDDYSYLDLIKIKRPLPSPNIGQNSFVIGTLFRQEDPTTPFIIKESIDAPNLEEDETILFKDELGGNTATLTFTSEAPINMSYEIFGQELLTNEEVNNSAVRASYTPSAILNQFTQLPASSLNEYLTINDDFKAHYDILDMIIDQNNDNAFVIANKIRNYLQDDSVFTFGFNELLNDGPEEGEDVVEWFCEHREGTWSEFASAFSVFCRAFGIASRFVDGFNSYDITEFQDENFEYTYAIKWKNIYNWAEIYVPFSTSGVGRWVQMDILRDSFGEGGNPLTDFQLTVESEYTTYSRPSQPDLANITATLSSATRPVDSLNIRFYDETIDSDNHFAEIQTDSFGKASVIFPIDSTQVAGPHIIRAEYGVIENYTYYMVEEPVQVTLDSASVQQINVSEIPAQSRVEGYVRDNETYDGIANAFVNFVLLQKGTNNRILNAFVNDITYTNVDGYFSMWLDFRDHIPYGEYDLRADFNGTWGIYIEPYSITYNQINDSSNTIDINVTKEITYDLLFFIDGRPTEYAADPNPATLVNIKRGAPINLSVVVFDPETSSVVSGETVQFYDYINGNVFINSDISDSNGMASILYSPGTMKKAGPNLIYAQVGNARNYSYFILNESIHVNLFSGPDPTTIEIIPSGGSQQFNIQGQITDEAGNPISYTEIRLKLLRGGLDYSGYLNPQQAYPYITGPDGNFNLNFQVDETTPIGNYSLRLDFNGTFVFEQFLDPNNQYPFTFNLNYFSNASLFQNELKVIDPSQVEIFLSVEGNPTRTLYDNFNKPQRYKSGEEAHFQVIITQSGSNPLPGTRVRIIDVYQNTVLDEYLFQISSPNFIQFNISINNTNFNFGGIHKINVRLYDPSNQPYPRVNSTFIVINKTMTFDNPTITTNIIQRNDGGFSVSGNMRDNGIGIRGLWVRLLLFDENYVNASKYLIGGNVYALTDNNGYFRFDINTIRFDCIQGPYQLRIDFNGSIQIIEVPGIDYIPNYMINASSNYVNLNVTAGTYISQVNYYTQSGLAPDKWINNDILYIIGDLNWDNSSGMVGFKVNVTVQLLDGTVIAYNDTTITATSGQFNASLIIDTTWPTYRSETKIVVYFEPLDNNLQYVDKSSLEFV